MYVSFHHKKDEYEIMTIRSKKLRLNRLLNRN